MSLETTYLILVVYFCTLYLVHFYALIGDLKVL